MKVIDLWIAVMAAICVGIAVSTLYSVQWCS